MSIQSGVAFGSGRPVPSAHLDVRQSTFAVAAVAILISGLLVGVDVRLAVLGGALLLGYSQLPGL